MAAEVFKRITAKPPQLIVYNNNEPAAAVWDTQPENSKPEKVTLVEGPAEDAKDSKEDPSKRPLPITAARNPFRFLILPRCSLFHRQPMLPGLNGLGLNNYLLNGYRRKSLLPYQGLYGPMYSGTTGSNYGPMNFGGYGRFPAGPVGRSTMGTMGDPCNGCGYSNTIGLDPMDPLQIGGSPGLRLEQKQGQVYQINLKLKFRWIWS